MPRLVEVESEDPRLDYRPADVARLFHCLDEKIGGWRIPDGDLAIRFVDEDSCRKLHADFFNDPELTDVMTFPGDPEDEHAGDLAVCPSYAAQSAPEHHLSFAEELALYLVHGWLHLAGLDDRDDAVAAAMRQAETAVMERLRAADCIPRFVWRD